MFLLCSCFCCDSRDFVGAASGYSQALYCPIQMPLTSTQTANMKETLAIAHPVFGWLNFSQCLGFGLISATFELGNCNTDRRSNDCQLESFCTSREYIHIHWHVWAVPVWRWPWSGSSCFWWFIDSLPAQHSLQLRAVSKLRVVWTLIVVFICNQHWSLDAIMLTVQLAACLTWIQRCKVVLENSCVDLEDSLPACTQLAVCQLSARWQTVYKLNPSMCNAGCGASTRHADCAVY